MISIVIPCYNEAGNISMLVEKFKLLVQTDSQFEVIFVNNGSTDNSKAIFEQKLEENKTLPFRLVTVDVNQGYGFGILAGLDSAKGSILSWTHADLQTDPLDLLVGLKLYISHSDENILVKGKRRNRPFLDAFFTKGMEYFAFFVLGKKLNDINAQPKIFSRTFFNKIRGNAPFDFSLDFYFLYWADVYGKILDFPVYFEKRQFGEAKGGGSMKTKIKLTKRTIKYILDFKRN